MNIVIVIAICCLHILTTGHGDYVISDIKGKRVTVFFRLNRKYLASCSISGSLLYCLSEKAPTVDCWFYWCFLWSYNCPQNCFKITVFKSLIKGKKTALLTSKYGFQKLRRLFHFLVAFCVKLLNIHTTYKVN